MFDAVVITCEHGGNRVPRRYQRLFAGKKKLLESHRGYDPGALTLARRFAKAGGWPLHFSTVTRLLVDLNRSLRHPTQFSEITSPLDWNAKSEILDEHYDPYRLAVEAEMRRLIDDDRRVLHLSVHSFTPELNGEVRRADIGLLYDPRDANEVAFCDAWRAALKKSRPDLVVRRNYPYRGTSDGFTSHLRVLHPENRYSGVELEVNQRWPLHDAAAWRKLQIDLVDTFLAALTSCAPP